MGSLVWLFSPAWDAVKLTLPVGWLHLSFRGHRPYRFRSNNGNCSELAPGLMFDDFLSIPDAESLPFYPLVLKLVVCVCARARASVYRDLGGVDEGKEIDGDKQCDEHLEGAAVEDVMYQHA